MCYVLKKGTTARTIFVQVRDAVHGRTPVVGLSHRSPGAIAAYLRAGETAALPIALTAGSLGKYQPGGIVEVDTLLMPGIYQLGIPDAALASGADSVVVFVGFAGAHVDPTEISLVAYDPQDEKRLGMSALGPEGRIAALRGAFPRLTERELMEDRALTGES